MGQDSGLYLRQVEEESRERGDDDVVLSYEWAGGQESGSRKRLEHEVMSTVTEWDREGDQRDGR
jgi:hypothetical protein